MAVNITFLGGADTVTGSKYLVQQGRQSVLVDCGLFQGYKQLRLRNWTPLPLAPAQVDAVLLTHAHLDHSGYLQEEDAAFANRHGFSKHAPALPLYTRKDALQSLRSLKSVRFDKSFAPLRGWKARFSPAGHILGAASLLLEVAGHRILFSGDLGRPDDLIMLPPAAPPAADTVLIESTYGDREHPQQALLAELGPVLQKVAARGGGATAFVLGTCRCQPVAGLAAQHAGAAGTGLCGAWRTQRIG